MCKVLKISKSLIYYESKSKTMDIDLENLIIKIFKDSRKNYGARKINIFHTDRRKEFKNKIIDEILSTFNIKRSLSAKGCPYDNAVAEAGFKVVKTEFAFNRIFNSLEELERELFDYVNWYNNIRIHGSLDYLSPVAYKLKYCSV